MPFLFIRNKMCQNNYLKSVELIYNYPISFYKEKDELKIYSLKDTLQISYYGDYELYRLPSTLDVTNKKIKGTEPYFIFKKKDKYGFLFNSLEDSTQGTKFQVDSFLYNRGVKGKDFDMPTDTLWSLVGTEEKNNEYRLDKYTLIKEEDETVPDSIFYYYSENLKDIEYSFSNRLDSLKGMKLYKIKLIYGKKFSPSIKSVLPQREFLLEIENVVVQNKKEIIDFIKRFEKCCHSP